MHTQPLMDLASISQMAFYRLLSEATVLPENTVSRAILLGESATCYRATLCRCETELCPSHKAQVPPGAPERLLCGKADFIELLLEVELQGTKTTGTPVVNISPL